MNSLTIVVKIARNLLNPFVVVDDIGFRFVLASTLMFVRGFLCGFDLGFVLHWVKP